MAMSKLKPCPFCGGKAILKDHGKGTGGWMISCENTCSNLPGMCGVIMVCPALSKSRTEDEIHESGKKNTVAAWNLRN